MTLSDPNLQNIQTYSRILMCREVAETVPLYNHSGVLWKLVIPKGHISSYLMELDNKESSCKLVLTPLEEVVTRGRFGNDNLRCNNEVYDRRYRVILRNGPDFMKYVYSKFKNKTWAYNVQTLNCHLCSGIAGSYPDDKTLLQGVLGCVDRRNKHVAQVGLKEMIVLLQNVEVEKRPRVKVAGAAGSSSD